MDLRRLARDLLNRAHEDVRDDGDPKKAGNICFNTDMLAKFKEAIRSSSFTAVILMYSCKQNIDVY